MYGIKLVHILTTFTPVNWLLICFICNLYSYSRGSGADMVDNSDCMPRSVISQLFTSVVVSTWWYSGEAMPPEGGDCQHSIVYVYPHSMML